MNETPEQNPEQLRPVDALIARWGELETADRLREFLELSHEDGQTVLTALSSDDQAELFQHLPSSISSMWMRYLAPDDAADVLQALEAEDRARLYKLLDAPTQREIDALLAYEEDEAGGPMSPRFVRLRPDVSVEVAIRYIRRQTRNNPETLYYIYVLSSNQRLEGVISLRELFSAAPEAIVADIMQRDPIVVTDSTKQEEVANIMAQSDLLAVPVLTEDGFMKGIITVDDVVDVIREEATEDIQKLGGTEALDSTYLDTSYTEMIRKRGSWLSVLFIGEMLTAAAMAHYEKDVAKAVILAMFIPLIISSGGNSGSQAATIVVRSLALTELKLRDWWRVARKELASGLTLGAWLGLLGFLKVEIWQHAGLFNYGEHSFLIATTVALSLVGVVTFGTLVGSLLPFLLRSVGFDPATSSAPFVATLVDVTGLIIYFTFAGLILSGTVL